MFGMKGPARWRGTGIALFVSVLLSIAGCTSSHERGGGGGGDPDGDGDGYARSVDCDDADPAVHPDAYDEGPSSSCPPGDPFFTGGANGRDDDCDGRVDEDPGAICNYFPDSGTGGIDADGDGHTTDTDCDDSNAAIHPGAEESCCDGVDTNCDGADDPEGWACNCFFDADGDGYGTGFGPGPDCNDADPTIHPDQPDTCGDWIDNDCDGLYDEDPNPDGTPCIIMNGMLDAPDDGERNA